jgi:hypothetical protein
MSTAASRVRVMAGLPHSIRNKASPMPRMARAWKEFERPAARRFTNAWGNIRSAMAVEGQRLPQLRRSA